MIMRGLNITQNFGYFIELWKSNLNELVRNGLKRDRKRSEETKFEVLIHIISVQSRRRFGMEKRKITVRVSVNVPIENVWKYWTKPEHIQGWNQASEEWHTPTAENDLRENGSFLYRMEAKDGSFGFDFEGVYKKIDPFKVIEYELDDSRKVSITFESEGGETVITETFEAESTQSAKLQEAGWQSILDHFKMYAEETLAEIK